MATITYYSAQIVEPTSKHARRIKITNRRTRNAFFRPWVGSNGIQMDVQLERQIVAIYTSPDLQVRILWNDEQFKMLFFAVKRES